MTSDEDRQRMEDANRFAEGYMAEREAVMEERNYRSPAQISATKDEITRRLKSAYKEAVKSEIQKWNAEVQDGEQDVKDVKQWAKKFSDNTWYHIGKDAVSMMGNVKFHVCGDDWNGKMDDCFITKYVKVEETFSYSGAQGRKVARRAQEDINSEDPRVIADLAANRKAPFCASKMAGKLEGAKAYWDNLRASKRGGFTVEDVLSNGAYADFVKTGHECYSEIGNMITGEQGRGFGNWLTDDEFNIKMVAENTGAGIKDDLISGEIVKRLERDHDSVIGIDHIMIYTAEGMREMKLKGAEGWKELGKTRLDQMWKELSSATMKEAGKIADTMDLTGLQEGDFPTPEEMAPTPGETSGKGRSADKSKDVQQDVEEAMDLELSWDDV